MAFERIGPERQAGCNPVADVAPMVGRRIAGVDADGLDRIDRLERLLDLRPAVDPRQYLGAGSDERQRRMGLARRDGEGDGDVRMDGAEVVRRPADESEDRAGTEGRDACPAAQDALGSNAAEADPLFVPAFDPSQFDLGRRTLRRRRNRATAARRARSGQCRSGSVQRCPSKR